MRAINDAQEHAARYNEEIDRGADPEAMADIGHRPPAESPYIVTRRLGSQVVAGETASTPTANPSPERGGPKIDTVVKIMRQRPKPPAAEKGGKSDKKTRAGKPKSRLSARSRMFVDGRGSDPDLM